MILNTLQKSRDWATRTLLKTRGLTLMHIIFHLVYEHGLGEVIGALYHFQ